MLAILFPMELYNVGAVHIFFEVNSSRGFEEVDGSCDRGM